MAVNQESVDKIKQVLKECSNARLRSTENEVKIIVQNDFDTIAWFKDCYEVSSFLRNNYKEMGFAQLITNVSDEDGIYAWFILLTTEALAR